MKKLIEELGRKARITEGKDVTYENVREIDLGPLEKELSKKIGTNVKLDVEDWRGSAKLRSQDLTTKAGVMASLFSDLRMESWGVQAVSDGSWWIPMQFSWQFQKGGSNGHEFLTAWYFPETGKWKFRMAGM